MKFLTTYSALMLVCFVLIGILPSQGEQEIYEMTVRLHVIAASDSDEDQAIKYEVRDRILAEYSKVLSEFENREEAEQYIEEHIADIKATANSVLTENEMNYSAEVYFDKETYPRREYDDISLPAGEYMSLRICLGGAEGQNWWCILFPPLCVSSATSYEYEEAFVSAGFTPEEYKIITGESEKYVLKFRILEILSDAAEKISSRLR